MAAVSSPPGPTTLAPTDIDEFLARLTDVLAAEGPDSASVRELRVEAERRGGEWADLASTAVELRRAYDREQGRTRKAPASLRLQGDSARSSRKPVADWMICLAAAVLSAVVTAAFLGFGFSKWRSDLQATIDPLEEKAQSAVVAYEEAKSAQQKAAESYAVATAALQNETVVLGLVGATALGSGDYATLRPYMAGGSSGKKSEVRAVTRDNVAKALDAVSRQIKEGTPIRAGEIQKLQLQLAELRIVPAGPDPASSEPVKAAKEAIETMTPTRGAPAPAPAPR